MKKILCLILIFTLLFCVSCNVTDDEDILNELPSESKSKSPESSKPDESSSNLEESLPPEESENISSAESSDKIEETEVPSGAGCEYYPSFFTYEEYEEFVGSIEKLPDDFITYDMLKDFGEFKSFRFYNNNYYLYRFIDENGLELMVTIKPLPNEIETYYMVTPHNINDLRSTTPTGDAAEYLNNNIAYRYYFNGELSSIEWYIGAKIINIFYQGEENNTFSDYPLDGETTFVSQLLSLQTAEAAVEAFNQKVEAEIAKNIADKQSKG